MVQVFDYVARGEFYMITDNTRPYVDHTFPFDANALVEERMRGVLSRKLDNTDNLARRSAILKGPMFRELARRARQRGRAGSRLHPDVEAHL